MAGNTNTKISRRRVNKDLNGVSRCAKYTLFGFNLIFWAGGGLFLGVGLYARLQSNSWDSLGGVSTDPAVLMIVVGIIIFLLGFCGCIGALRENLCLLRMFTYSLIILLVLEITGGALAFVFKGQVEQQISIKLVEAIQKYHITNKQTDLDDAVEGMQKAFKCCGAASGRDWLTNNAYHNCTRETFKVLLTACGVPNSCCRNSSTDSQCGYKVYPYPNMTFADRSRWPRILKPTDYIYTGGCAKALLKWVEDNYLLIGIVAVTFLCMQLIGICLAINMIETIKYLLAVPTN